jgi:hypothetical protein
MLYRLAADLMLALHLAFIIFVIFGGLVALCYRWMLSVHLPAAVWGAFVEISGRICPLTTWENSFRRSAGESGYADSFIEHYLVPIIYPAALTRNIQFWLAGFVVVVNVVIYALLLYRWKKPQ